MNSASRGGAQAPSIKFPHSHVSLKQWNIFHAVISCGSFSAAAEYLHVTQPAVSYTIAKLEEQLGVPLLSLDGRRAKITSAGRELLERSDLLLREALRLEDDIRTLRRRHRPPVRVVVSQGFPEPLLLRALRDCSREDEVGILLTETSDDKVGDAIAGGRADVSVSRQEPPDCVTELLLRLELVPVVKQGHRLLAMGRPVSDSDLEGEIEVSVEPELAEDTDGNLRNRRWRVSSMSTAITAVTDLGSCYAWLPRHRVQQALDEGRLRVLPIELPVRQSSYFVAHCKKAPMVEVRRFVDALKAASSGHVWNQSA